jgi:fumarylpyruvate hydrolase
LERRTDLAVVSASAEIDEVMQTTISAPEVVSLAIAGGGRFPVRRIYCVGRNYVEHIREMKESDERDPPFFFQKPRDAIVENEGVVPYPPATQDLQYEAELVVAIGRHGAGITKERALDYVFGYGVGIDMTRRDRQKECIKLGIPWEIGKAFDASAPCSEIVPHVKCGHVQQGRISLVVNGELRQDSNIDRLIWKVPEIISNLSMHYALHAGDLIYTGTPAGVSSVAKGDELVAEVQGVAKLRVCIG